MSYGITTIGDGRIGENGESIRGKNKTVGTHLGKGTLAPRCPGFSWDGVKPWHSPCPCQHIDADLTPAHPTAEYCIRRAAWARPEGLSNPSACSTAFQKIPPMVHYFGKGLRLRAKLSLLLFTVARNGPVRLLWALLGPLYQTPLAAMKTSAIEIDAFFTFVLLRWIKKLSEEK